MSASSKNCSTAFLLLFGTLFYFVSSLSHASFISLATDEIRSLESQSLGQTSPLLGDTLITNHIEGGAFFVSYWHKSFHGDSQAGAETPDSWMSDWNFDFSSVDSFQQQVINRDENSWTFQATINVNDNVELNSSSLTLGPSDGSSANLAAAQGTLFVDLSETAITTINWIKFTVSADLPIDTYDRLAEYELRYMSSPNQVPLPPSYLLFVSSIIMILIRKKVH